MNGKITYYFQRPPAVTENSYSDKSTTEIKGFLHLNIHSDCKIIERKNEKKSFKYSFKVKESSSISLIFYASNEQERSDWIETIQEAIRGIHHFNPSISTAFIHNRSSSSPPTLLTLNPNNNNIAIHSRRSYRKSSTSVQLGYQTVEYPKMSGYLKKKSIEGKTLGFRNIKTRFNIYFCYLYYYYYDYYLLV